MPKSELMKKVKNLKEKKVAKIKQIEKIIWKYVAQ